MLGFPVGGTSSSSRDREHSWGSSCSGASLACVENKSKRRGRGSDHDSEDSSCAGKKRALETATTTVSQQYPDPCSERCDPILFKQFEKQMKHLVKEFASATGCEVLFAYRPSDAIPQDCSSEEVENLMHNCDFDDFKCMYHIRSPCIVASAAPVPSPPPEPETHYSSPRAAITPSPSSVTCGSCFGQILSGVVYHCFDCDTQLCSTCHPILTHPHVLQPVLVNDYVNGNIPRQSNLVRQDSFHDAVCNKIPEQRGCEDVKMPDQRGCEDVMVPEQREQQGCEGAVSHCEGAVLHSENPGCQNTDNAGMNNEVSETGVQLTEEQILERRRAIQLHLELLLHACSCRGPCPSENCSRMKTLLAHGASCKVTVRNGCALCKRVWCLLTLHARHCQREMCPVPRCVQLREQTMNTQANGAVVS